MLIQPLFYDELLLQNNLKSFINSFVKLFFLKKSVFPLNYETAVLSTSYLQERWAY